jgi:hypothetical protein
MLLRAQDILKQAEFQGGYRGEGNYSFEMPQYVSLHLCKK